LSFWLHLQQSREANRTCLHAIAEGSSVGAIKKILPQGHKKWRVPGDKSANNGDNLEARMATLHRRPRHIWGKSLVITLRWSALPTSLFVGCMLLQPARVDAGWWYHAPKDFEDCADLAEKAATKEDKAAALTQCNAKFAGRRKPGGGYTYYDFMQNRSFDIAGPNPTPEEQKYIDQQYTLFLDRQRHDSIVAALAAKQEQQQERQQQVQQAAFESEAEKIPLPMEAPNKKALAKARAARARYCAEHSFSCQWPKLSEGIDGLKKILFGSSTTNKDNTSKDKRG
jgi:hypothetical protein